MSDDVTFNPWTNKLDWNGQTLGSLDARYLKLNCSNDPLTDDLEISQSGVSFITVGSTDHLVAGIRFKRSDWGTDTYTDYSFYNNSAGDLLLDKLLSAVTTNILMYDEDIARWTFAGDVHTLSIFSGGIVRTDNYQNLAGDESFVWADGDDWWELSNDLRVVGHAAIGADATIDPATIVTVKESTAVDGQALQFELDLTGAGSFAGAMGIVGVVDYQGTNRIGNTAGIIGAVDNTGSGVVDSAVGLEIFIGNLSTGTITEGIGIKIDSADNSGGGTWTNNYGLYIQDQSAVGFVLSYNLFSAGATAENYFEGVARVDNNIILKSGSKLIFDGA